MEKFSPHATHVRFSASNIMSTMLNHERMLPTSEQEYTQRVLAMERTLYRVARSLLRCDADCADAIQEAVFRGWMKRESLHEPRYFNTWLIRILINECYAKMRRRRFISVPLDEARNKAEEKTDIDSTLRDALEALDEKYRVLLVLHHVEGYTLEEIAKILTLPVTMVKSRLHYARKALRSELAKGGKAYD